MNLSKMQTIVRRDLHDEDATNYRWSDDELERHITHAVKELSESVPLEQTITMSTIKGSRNLDISGLADRIMIQAVEYPVDKFPKIYKRFSVWGDTLTILGIETPDGDNACIYYGKLHTLDSEGSTIPTPLEDLIATGACGYAAVEWAGFAINRINVGGSTTPQEFLNWGQAKLDFFRKELKRLGRRDRIRIIRMYKTYNTVTSKTTDYGP